MRLTERAHTELKKFLNPGNQVIDATTGNGYDTVFLARQVGANGKVFAFDLQAESIEESTRLIEAEKLVQRVTFFQSCHSKISEFLPVEIKGGIQAVTFNLGYLPGGDKQIITHPDTTLSALVQSYEYLSVNGIISLIAYRGHDGGNREYNQLIELIKKMKWSCQTYPGNESDHSPMLFIIRKFKTD